MGSTPLPDPNPFPPGPSPGPHTPPVNKPIPTDEPVEGA